MNEFVVMMDFSKIFNSFFFCIVGIIFVFFVFFVNFFFIGIILGVVKGLNEE